MHVFDENRILVLDFGSQTTQLIARRIRELKVYCEIFPYNADLHKIKEFNPKGIVLSGGPASALEDGSPTLTPDIFDYIMTQPVLGICYGLQLLINLSGGTLIKGDQREFGHTNIEYQKKSLLFNGFDFADYQVWMSHGDSVDTFPKEFYTIAMTGSGVIAAVGHREKPIFGVQFHPEVTHTTIGKKLLENFVINICKCKPTWNMHSFIENNIKNIKKTVGNEKVICALSGGVDSTVTSLIINKAIGKQLTCIFVNNGLLRKNEAEIVLNFLKKLDLNVDFVDATDRFLTLLKGVEDPELKRKIIGNEFIQIFEEEAKKLGDVQYLAQGTLYPDVIESVSFKGPSATIKSHHNVGGLPEKMNLKLIEPLRELFKDEVRELGKELEMPEDLIFRHPFPGPGLAIRILGDITPQRLFILREADAIVIDELKKSGWYRKMWQGFAVLLPIRTVGVMGDERTYENVLAIRAVDSLDAMTADWTRLPYDLLARLSNRIINEVKGINRVCFDISSKPPATIEWE
jgi:GMP synthase (glutamine-hydrolysing)